MSNRTTIGIDNGTTGTIGILGPDGAIFEAVPTIEVLSHVQAKGFTKRIDRSALMRMFLPYCDHPENVKVYIEAPFTMAYATTAVLMAHRAYEAVLTVCEDLRIGQETIAPRDWQPHVLGKKISVTKVVKGKVKVDTKKASMLRGAELYPHLAESIRSHGDADGLLIAHHFHNR